MTKREIAELLQIVRAAYPNTKINDPGRMIQAWELAFGGDEPETIYMAARFHMRNNKFFPTVADIEKCRGKGKLLYGNSLPENEIKSLKPYSVNMSTEILNINGTFCDLCELCDERDQDNCPYDT